MVLALVLGAGSIFLIKKMIDVERQKALASKPVIEAAPEVKIEMGDVLFVKEDLETGTPLNDMNVGVLKVPVTVIPDNALRSLDQVKDLFAYQSLFKNEWLLQPKARTRESLPKPSMVIEPGKRLISVRVDEVKANSFLVKNGDFVDLVGSFELEDDMLPTKNVPMGKKITITFLQRVKIFDIIHGSQVAGGEETAEGGKGRLAMGTNATFEVTQREAEIITNAESVATSIWLVLRRFDDTAIQEPQSELEKNIIANLLRANNSAAEVKAPPPKTALPSRKTVF
ncbi:MAG: Flp pilus assembly protein CpaB [Candidatus Methylacidiphilales bacterium]|nr:Flp pilus assembly protein CpaB [Candidatus Methylacidiphilales bacterium]